MGQTAGVRNLSVDGSDVGRDGGCDAVDDGLDRLVEADSDSDDSDEELANKHSEGATDLGCEIGVSRAPIPLQQGQVDSRGEGGDRSAQWCRICVETQR